MRGTAKAPSSRSTKATFTDLRMRFGIATALLAVIAFALPALASADPLGSFEAFKTGLRPAPWIVNDVTGPEGNVWFVDNPNASGTSAIGKITPEGTITEYVEGENLSGLNEGANLTGIAVGPEGKLWVTDMGPEPSIAVIDPTSPEAATEYSTGLNGGSKPQGIAVGPDGNLWFADAGTTPAIGMIEPGGEHKIKEFSGGLNPSSTATGDLTEASNLVANLTVESGIFLQGDPITGEGIPAETNISMCLPSCAAPTSLELTHPATASGTGVTLTVTSPSIPKGIVAGPDGNLWFTDLSGHRAIGRINPSTHEIKEFAIDVSTTPGGSSSAIGPWGIAAGADGNVWFTGAGEENSPAIGRITPSGEITKYGAGLPEKSVPLGLTTAGGKLWFSDNGGVTELQEFKFEGTWETGNEFELCGKNFAGNEQCFKKPYSTSLTTLRNGIRAAYESLLGVGAISSPLCLGGTPVVCSFTIAAFGNLNQVTCTKLTGAGTCEGKTSRNGVPKGIGSITYSGEITTYPIDGLFGTAQVAYSGGNGNLWFPSGIITRESIAKFGIETGPTNRRTLTLTKSAGGTGGMGSVKSKPAGVNCGTACNEAVASMYKATPVTLTAKPSSTSTFVKWENAVEGGPCDESASTTCTVPMSEDEAVTAVFGGTSKAIFNPQALSVNKGESTGYGTVKASGLVCEAACTTTTVLYQGPNVEKAKPGKTVALTATAAPGSEFVEWTGACTGSGACSVEMSETKEVTATFEALPAQTLTLTKSAGGSGGMGSVKSKPAGINCGTACNSAEATLWEGAVVTLTAKPSATSTFVEWENAVEGSDCDGSTSTTCTVSLNVAEEITAVFGGTSKAIFNPQPLSLSKSGSGLGTVKASGLVCEAACASTTVLYQGPNVEKAKPGKTVVLTQAAAPGSEFVEWTGACTGSGACSVEMSEAKNVTATFDELE